MGDTQANDPNAMPLDAFIAEAIGILRTQPDATEICVERVHPLRFAAQVGQESYDRMFKGFNDTMTAAAKAHPK